MTLVLYGVVHGNTVELNETANLADGREVRVMLVETSQGNGSGAREDPFPRPREMEVARAAFLRDLPALLADKNSAGRWFLYHGSTRIRAAKTQRDLVRHCQARGWNPADCYIDMAIPHLPEPEAVDPSLFEVDG